MRGISPGFSKGPDTQLRTGSDIRSDVGSDTASVIARNTRRNPVVRMAVAVIALVVIAVGCAPLPQDLTREQQVGQLIAFVEARRGHGFITEPTVTFVPDAEFRAHVLDAIDSAAPELAVDEVAFKALGWMPPSGDLFESYRIAFGNAVVGFYDPESKVLEVRGSELTPYRREVVVHELTHALDDQIFDLTDTKGPGVLNEEQMSYLVAVEGDAAHVQRHYVKSMNPFDQLASVIEQLSFPIDPEILGVPVALLSISQTPYLRGPDFVSGLGGLAAVDEMFQRFPVTTEQAWDVTKYLDDERAEPVDSPPADGVIVASGTWGRFLTSLIITDGINLDGRIKSVTDGWAGDAFVTWTEGERSCIRIDTRQDDEDSSARLGVSLQKWAGRSGASLERLDATTTRLTRCA